MRPSDVVIVDWSAAARPRLGVDSIWIAHASVDHDDIDLVNLATRAAAEAWLGDRLTHLAALGRSVVCAVDFSLGYPVGYAAHLAGLIGVHHLPLDRALRAATAALICDGANNANNRFEVANAVNERSGAALFWGRPHRGATSSLRSLSPTTRRPPHLAPNPFARFRIAEVTSGQRLSTNWQLLGAGSVGSQVLTGLPVVERLRVALEAAVWPFDRHGAAAVTFAEVWPGLFATSTPPAGIVRDAWQVTTTARALAAFDAATWSTLWNPASVAALDVVERGVVLEDEGWMLGVR